MHSLHYECLATYVRMYHMVLNFEGGILMKKDLISEILQIP